MPFRKLLLSARRWIEQHVELLPISLYNEQDDDRFEEPLLIKYGYYGKGSRVLRQPEMLSNVPNG